ncbi:hypothetical protein J5N97_008257 [Dioscorea zingiberensis]|uniref:Uncharacterized protein n=1 Tax=Dioscorea zingiberensis TaxID=325984 RepID=A0A9D5DDG5_9LILI|nr:hypothetical protein J5N97_008257 [Dioscorea zingiberensis]
MDFHSLSRRELQALCKKNRIPANITNVAMADALQALQTVEGLDGIQELLSPSKESMMSPDLPRTGRRTSVRRRAVQDEVAFDKVSTAPRTRRGSARVSEIKKMELECEEGGKQGEIHEEVLECPAAQGSPLPRSRRVIARSSETVRLAIEEEEGEKQEKEVLLETPAACTGRRTRAAARGGSKREEEEKEEGTKTGRYRTRLSSRKETGEVTGVSARPRTRSTRASAAVKMVALVQEEDQEKKKQEIEVVLSGEKSGELIEEPVAENPIEAAKIDDGEQRDDHQEESPIRGLVIMQNDQEILAEINEPIKQSHGEEISREDKEENREENKEYQLPDPQASDEVTGEIIDSGDLLSGHQELEPEIPAIINQSPNSSFNVADHLGEKAEENLTLQLAGITLNEAKHSADDLEFKEATEIKTSSDDIQSPTEEAPNVESPAEAEINAPAADDLNFNAGITLNEAKHPADDLEFKEATEIKTSSENLQANLDIQSLTEEAPNVESPAEAEIKAPAADDLKGIFSAEGTTAPSPPQSCEIERSESMPPLGCIYSAAQNDKEKARGLTGLTDGDFKVIVKAEKQNQQKKDLNELSMRKLRALVKEMHTKNNKKVEGKRSALAELDENQL